MEVDNISESGQSVRSMRSSWLNGKPDGQDLDHQFANTNMNSNEDAYEDFIYDDKGSEELSYVVGNMENDTEEYREDNEEGIERRNEEVEPWCYDDGSPIDYEEFDLYSEGDQVVEEKRLTWPEKVDTLRTRTFVDYLSRKANAKQTLVIRTREELDNCLTQIKQLEQGRDKVFAEIEAQEQEENITAVIRLHSQHDKLCRELELEAELEGKIREKLLQAEYQSNLVELEQGRAVELEQELLEKERIWKEERNEEAGRRLMKEEKSAVTVVAQEKLKERMSDMKRREEEERRRYEAEEAERCREKHQQFLARSLEKTQKMEKMQRQRDAEVMETRIKSVLTLKSDIATNKENLRVQIVRDKARDHQTKEMKRKWLEDVEAEGRNAMVVFARQQRTKEFKQEKQQFEDKQREREVEIAKRILMEKRVLEKKKRVMPELFMDAKTEKSKFVKPLPKRNLRVIDRLQRAALPPPLPEYDLTRGAEDDDSEADVEQDEDVKQIENEELCHVEAKDQEMHDLAQPEFEGLWDQFKPYKAPKDTEMTGIIRKGASKMENEILAQRLQKLREGIVVKQIAVGREFKGCAFKSKPEVIHFKDFDVGKSYQKRVVLTNVSHTLNVCKLSGLSEQLKDFIELTFHPPGQMSAGLTCELTVNFKPMINKDLEGEVKFLAQTGPFSIPIVCSTKKCIMKVDSSVVDFGTSVVGETLKKTVTLTNAGALSTSFQFIRCFDKKTEEIDFGGKPEEYSSPLDENAVKESEEKISAAAVTGEGTLANEKQKREEEEGVEEEIPIQGVGDDKEQASVNGGWQDVDTRLLIPEDMTVGQVVSGTIAAYSSLKLEVVWLPSIPGRVSTEFAISFQEPDVDDILVRGVGDAVEIPVWVERKAVDLKICMFDRLFQDSIVIHNRAATAYSLKFEVCKELRNHLELLPKSGYIQAQSQFTAQLKFLPRRTLFQDASQFFDEDTGVFEAPLVIHVVGQTLPVVFSVHAVVTSSDLEFDQTILDFGHCTIHEMAVIQIQMTNQSLLPQEFGFMGCPDFIDIQPNDGFGTLLPRETIYLDVIFRPKKANVYHFDLICKSLINREFRIQCHGIGVHPLLKLSHQIVQFPATAINDNSTVVLEVINDHRSPNEILRPAPKIGKGPVAPVGPTSFEFRVPDGVPISISPQVGTVLPGQKSKVSVRFSPTFDDREVREEAVRIVTNDRRMKAEEEFQMALKKAREAEEQAANAKGKKDKSPKEKSGSKASGPKASIDAMSSAAIAERGPACVEPPLEEDIVKNSPEYYSGLASLIKKFTGKFSTFSIPCYLASGTCGRPGELAYSVENTLYIEVNCPVVRPQLLVLSNSSQTTVDFGEVSIGQRIIRMVTVQNISDRKIDLHGCCLNPEGPFVLLNALRALAPDQTLNLRFSFAPHKTEKFQQVQEISSPMSTTFLTLKGVGISPVVTVSVTDNLLDLGNVMSGDVRKETFKIINTSKLSVDYRLRLDSQSLHQKQRMQLMAVVHTSSSKHKNSVGTQNLSGKQVFDCVPKEGTISPGATQDIVVTFAPDQPSEHFRDRCHVLLFGQDKESHAFDIVANGRAHNMYVCGGDVLSPEVETLSVVPELEKDEDAKAPSVPVLVMLHSLATDTECTVATKDIVIGCVKLYSSTGRKVNTKKSLKNREGGHSAKQGKLKEKGKGKALPKALPEGSKKGKTNAEWSFDGMQQATALGFSIDPLKGMVEAGTERTVTISWTPPSGHNPNLVASTAINCTIRGDVTETYRFILKAFVNTN